MIRRCMTVVMMAVMLSSGLCAAEQTVVDPIPALGDGDAVALAKPTPKIIQTLIDHYVDRIEAWHSEHSQPTPELLAYFKANSSVRREFWLALDPRDDAPAALRIMDRLRAKDPKKLVVYQHLAIALAVVHDQPRRLTRSRRFELWAVQDFQFGDTLSYEAIYDWFTDPKNQAMFVFKPKDLAWPLMVHLVDLDVSQAEIDWAVQEYGKQAQHLELQALYHQVPYDELKRETQTKTALGDRPYTMANLRHYGGVCVDQAHFASRIAKIFGVPSMKCGGEGRYGSASLHAWSGFLAVDPKTRFPVLTFTGRYSFDYYYIGTAYDPQRGVKVFDRQIELLYDGVSGRYESYITAAVLTRMAVKLEHEQPTLALALVKEAIRANEYVKQEWLLAMRLAKSGVLPSKDADQLYQQLVNTMGLRHPDLCAWCQPDYLASIPAAQDAKRQKLYLGLYDVLGKAQRPDLQIDLRLQQLDELAKAGRAKDVVQLAFNAVGPNIGQGSMVIPLVDRVVTLSKQFATQDKTFRVDLVRDSLRKYAEDFPKRRGDTVSPAWVEFQKLMESL